MFPQNNKDVDLLGWSILESFEKVKLLNLCSFENEDRHVKTKCIVVTILRPFMKFCLIVTVISALESLSLKFLEF